MKPLVPVVFLIFLIGAGSVLWSEVLFSSALELVFFDVGQGDAIFFETPLGHQVLIDGGPDDGVLSGLGRVMPFWDKSLDLVVLTHPDADHVTGLVSVLERYDVDTILQTGKETETRPFLAFKEAMRRKGARVVKVKAGDRVVFEDSDAFLDILYPDGKADLESMASNETSIIARLQYHGASVLLGGDTTSKVERYLVQKGAALESDILKVAHHGSLTSSSPEFLEAVSPKTAVISVGKDNRFHHPSDKVLAELAGYGIQIRRTDLEGTIIYYFK